MLNSPNNSVNIKQFTASHYSCSLSVMEAKFHFISVNMGFTGYKKAKVTDIVFHFVKDGYHTASLSLEGTLKINPLSASVDWFLYEGNTGALWVNHTYLEHCKEPELAVKECVAPKQRSNLKFNDGKWKQCVKSLQSHNTSYC